MLSPSVMPPAKGAKHTHERRVCFARRALNLLAYKASCVTVVDRRARGALQLFASLCTWPEDACTYAQHLR